MSLTAECLPQQLAVILLNSTSGKERRPVCFSLRAGMTWSALKWLRNRRKSNRAVRRDSRWDVWDPREKKKPKMWRGVICRCQTSKSPTLTFDGNEFQLGTSPSGPQKTLICQKRMRWKLEDETVWRNTASKRPTHGAHGDAERRRGCRRGLHGGGRGLVRGVSRHTAAAPGPVWRRLCKHSQMDTFEVSFKKNKSNKNNLATVRHTGGLVGLILFSPMEAEMVSCALLAQQTSQHKWISKF